MLVILRSKKSLDFFIDFNFTTKEIEKVGEIWVADFDLPIFIEMLFFCYSYYLNIQHCFFMFLR